MESIVKNNLNKYVLVLNQDVLDLEQKYKDMENRLSEQSKLYQQTLRDINTIVNDNTGIVVRYDNAYWQRRGLGNGLLDIGGNLYRKITLDETNPVLMNLFEQYQVNQKDKKKLLKPWWKFW